MMHEFVTYSDGTLVVSSDMRKKENGEEYIIVCFERPTENGFDTIIFELLRLKQNIFYFLLSHSSIYKLDVFLA